MATIRVLRQRDWTDAELEAAGFRHYFPKKRLVMAHVIEEPTDIEVTLEVLVVGAGDIICYTPGDVLRDELDDYEHWPVRRDLFRRTYRAWDEPGWRPNAVESHLMANGCRAYYKWVGIWALRLPKNIYVQSLESTHPVLVPAGRWLCIGLEGEPYNMSEINFRKRYIMPSEV